MSIKILAIFLLFLLWPNPTIAFCPPGCDCNDQMLTVVCEYPGLTSIPILLNPMLKSLTIRQSNGLKMDTFTIALYPELESLDLSNNQIVHIPDGFFSQLAKLKILNLRGNNLKRILPKIFDKMPVLESLDLSSNQIERVASNVFDSVPNLRHLNLSSNLLHAMPPAPGLHKLKQLNLAANRFSKLPSWDFFNGSAELEELDMAGNILSELNSNAFEPLHKLKKLDLSANLISYAESDAFNGLDQLLELNLARNLLSTPNSQIAESRKNWPKLPANLQRLDLSGNAWTEIPTMAFSEVESIRELILEDMNQLQEIKPNAFANLPNLQRLSLANSNFLSKMDPNAFGGRQPSLAHLDLSNCQFSTLAPESLYDWSQLKTLKLHGNRWNCDCTLMSFLPPILDNLHTEQGQFVANAVCMEPVEFRDEPISEVAKKNIFATSECDEGSGGAATAFLEENFIWIASIAAFLMLCSLIFLAYCICFKQTRKSPFCCSWTKTTINQPKRSQSRAQFYPTGSTYTESLIYEKAPCCSANSAAGINFLQSTLYNCGLANSAAKGVLVEQQTSPSTSDESNGGTSTAQNATMAHSTTYSSNMGDDEYYSSIILDSLYCGQEYHHSPPKSPPPPPPPIFSDPPNWPPPNLLALLPACQVAAPPYQLRLATLEGGRQPTCSGNCQTGQGSAPPGPRSIHAPQPPARRVGREEGGQI